MPYKANEPRRHKIPKARYKIENEYDAALRRRGSLGDARGDRRVDTGNDRATGPAEELFGRRDRSGADAQAGVRAAVAPERGPARVDHGPAWPRSPGARPYYVLPPQRRSGCRDGPEEGERTS